jgi:Ribonuclease G/E
MAHDQSARRRYMEECPACFGTGKVPRLNSTILHGCMLCWERGVVSTIVADRWRRKREEQSDSVH